MLKVRVCSCCQSTLTATRVSSNSASGAAVPPPVGPVPPDAPVVVQFSEAYDLTTVQTTLEVVESGEEIPCDCLRSSLGKSFLEIAPLEVLKRGTEYEITIANPPPRGVGVE